MQEYRENFAFLLDFFLYYRWTC